MPETRSAPERCENGAVQKVCGMMRRVDRCGGAQGPRPTCPDCCMPGSGHRHVVASPGRSIKNPIAVFAALDKVTGRISHLEIPINQTVEFGALKVTPRVCDTSPPTETPHTASFVEVDETKLTGEVERIFTGWMFAESPGLHAVEHPVFDVWLTSCKTRSAPASSASNQNAPAPDTAPASDAAPAPADAAAARRRLPRRRPRPPSRAGRCCPGPPSRRPTPLPSSAETPDGSPRSRRTSRDVR